VRKGVKVPCNENIFREPDETDVYMNMDDQEDNDDYLEKKQPNQYVNFFSYDTNEHLDLDDHEKLELYNIFSEIEEELQNVARGRRRRKSTKRRKY
jgi:hypothetical protein